MAVNPEDIIPGVERDTDPSASDKTKIGDSYDDILSNPVTADGLTDMVVIIKTPTALTPIVRDDPYPTRPKSPDHTDSQTILSLQEHHH